MKRSVLIFLAVWTLVYLFGSFIAMDINPENWSGEGRSLQAFFGGGGGIFAAIMDRI